MDPDDAALHFYTKSVASLVDLILAQTFRKYTTSA